MWRVDVTSVESWSSGMNPASGARGPGFNSRTLGTAFKLAANETGANFRQDGFTSATLVTSTRHIYLVV
uniref:Uncharacterized protein n=1 Tax=Peronospora matthiolae TaxID=2874970 RepID=A0AAV1VEP9_9STRA